jgi:N-acetylmuramoyl-L-alanine amidase
MNRTVNLLVIHCSATRDGKSLMTGDARRGTLRSAAQVIDRWHGEPLYTGDELIRRHKFQRQAAWVAKFNPRLAHIGYHGVIDVDGSIESGRHLDEPGAHAEGHNSQSFGVCMVGTGRFTPAQWARLKQLVTERRPQFPGVRICGHRDLSPDLNHDGRIDPWEWRKTCPGFDVATWLARGMEPLPENVFQEPVKEA